MRGNQEEKAGGELPESKAAMPKVKKEVSGSLGWAPRGSGSMSVLFISSRRRPSPVRPEERLHGRQSTQTWFSPLAGLASVSSALWRPCPFLT